MVTQYGMSDKFGLMGLATQENQYLTGRTVLNCGDATAAEVDQEVMKILKDSYEQAKKLLSENRDVMDKIAEFLIEKETITGKEFMKIFREMKGIPEPADVNKTAGEKLADEVKSEEHQKEEAKKPEVQTEDEAEKRTPEVPADVAQNQVPEVQADAAQAGENSGNPAGNAGGSDS